MTNKTDVNEIKFRCSGLGHIVGGVKEKPGELQETVKTNLIDIFVSWKYGRREDLNNKYISKGNEREEDGITLLSLERNRFFKKNNIRLENDFISGECDLFIGESIENAEETHDIKSSFSLHTFTRAKHKKIDDLYKWQGVGYMWLTGAKKHTINYCLLNGTARQIMREKQLASFNFGLDFEKNPEYIKKCKQIEINHIFDLQSFCDENPTFEFHNDLNFWSYDIPRNERLFSVEILRNEDEIEYLKRRVPQCREWIKQNLLNI